MNLTTVAVEDIEKILGAGPDGPNEDDEYCDGWDDWYRRELTVDGLGVIKVVEQEGGEGEGDHYHVVWSVTADDGSVRFFRKDGYYASYDGVTWDGNFGECLPVVRSVTFYEFVK